jgi:hypothetical protein
MAVSIDKVDVITVPIQPNWNGKYRIEYDGKYITLFGEDKNYPGFKWTADSEEWFEEMVLVGCVEEVRNASPFIEKVDDEFIYIKLI